MEVQAPRIKERMRQEAYAEFRTDIMRTEELKCSLQMKRDELNHALQEQAAAMSELDNTHMQLVDNISLGKKIERLVDANEKSLLL